MMKNSRWPNTSKKHDMQYWGWWWYYSSSSWGLEFGNQFGIAHQLSHGAKLNNAYDSRVYWKTRSHGVVLLWCRPVVSNDFIHTLLYVCAFEIVEFWFGQSCLIVALLTQHIYEWIHEGGYDFYIILSLEYSHNSICDEVQNEKARNQRTKLLDLLIALSVVIVCLFSAV